ncbi:MAG: DNA topoisomerase, partial [Pseudomonadales bacterium]
KDNFGKNYLPEEPVRYSSKDGAQEAHEAIRPSDVNVEATKLVGMERDAERLYELIRRQFLACQMMPALYTSTRITVKAGDFELRTKGRILRFDGYTRVMPSKGKDEDVILPDVEAGAVLELGALIPKQHFTKPTARYTEASLVKELEKQGIGRPSTYASIISTIQDRGYVEVQNRRFYACKMGDIVIERLNENFADLMDYSFTARMENALDDIAQGSKEWKELLNQFYQEFSAKLESAQGEDGMRPNSPTLTDIKCTSCERDMMIRTGSTGVFLGCSGYSLPPKERCKETLNLTSGDEVVSVDGDDEEESRILLNKHRCKICDSAMDSYLIDTNRKLHICGNNPDCPGFEVEKGEYRIKGYEGPSIECDKCSNEMQLKTGRFGKFFGCTNEECKNTRKLLRNGEAAPPKMDPVPMPELACEKVEDTYILRDGASGLFLAASKFPRNRETRAPKVKELLPHRSEIDPKYSFLFDAPVEDDQGFDTIVRYSRKTKEQYVMTELEGKATGWKAYYNGSKWDIELPKPKATKAKAKAKPKKATKSAE